MGFDRVIVCPIVLGVFDKMLPKWYWAFCKSCQNSIGFLVMIGNIISLVRVWLVLSLNFVFLCLIVDYLFN